MSSQNSYVNASLSSQPLSAGTSSTSTVRSRPRRLVSFIEDGDVESSLHDDNYSHNESQPFTSGLSTTLSANVGSTRSRGPSPSSLLSRGSSPLPMKHPSRATQPANRSYNEGSSPSLTASQFAKTSSSKGASDFLDSSWSSLQNLASSVLGSDTGRSVSQSGSKGHSRRKPSRSDIYIRSIPRSSPAAWGPSAPAHSGIGTGTKEERQALVQAKKREALLLAESDPITSGAMRHKRRDSGDYFDQPIDHVHEDDALAYIHQVQASDSITGVTIKYGCQPAIFRKANGFWPNDNIQSRKTVLLPVDACSVKGRPIAPPQVDLLTLDSEDASGSSLTPIGDTPVVSVLNSEAPESSETDRNQVWKHETWVTIEGFQSPVQIGRVPRKALGFFPRTRRKSVSYTDEESLQDDLLGDLTGTQSLKASRAVPVDGTPPQSQRQVGQSKPVRPQHRRRNSSVHLIGTGVGTLDRSSTAPGPALDGLSKFVSQHMPNLMPPPMPETLRGSSFGSESTTVSNASTGLENIGGAIGGAVEGWIRKVATRTKAGINELQQVSGSPGDRTTTGRSRALWGLGDLIELDDASEDHSPSMPRGNSSRREEPASKSTSSSIRLMGSSASAMSRSRAPGLESDSSVYRGRTKDT
ncbi:hypothetical protein N7539_006768 [Penicillium diatomitis]|uniref:LysM domain-containing protein n=1 Tax=Penicillium diatomitis TaxID=2819901 RepID=A0A9X0BS93_9EURO|nr:uncharacterized protein N7539_006768 [Penicillium diatomitis]KAJ5480874.1 hypothetical protein N7539_006768 [Penicillium diatomitis]